jgi:HEAT repeat protein
MAPDAKDPLPALIAALKDRTASVRLRAIWTLEKIGPSAAASVPALVDAFEDERKKVREAAAKAMNRIGQSRSNE